MKTPADYQREYRERKKERLRLAGDPTDAITKVPFNEYLPEDGNWSSVAYALEWAGINSDGIPQFETDDDPGYLEGDSEPNRGSIGRAERMVGCLLDAATELAGIIARYKRKEIADRIHEIETGDLSDPATRKQALHDIVRLKKMLDQLDKQVRRTLPQWEVKGG